MINLLKPKIILVGIAFIIIFCISSTADAFSYSGVLKLGSSGSQVSSLQNALGVSPTTGDFDYTTRGKVVEFQLEHGFVTDGVVGPITGKALSKASGSSGMVLGATSSAPSPYLLDCTSGSLFSAITGKLCKDPLIPVGCVSNTDYSEYSTTTGLPCAESIVYQEGCSSEYGFSITNGKSCSLPIGCTGTTGYSKLTGKACNLTNTYVLPYPGCNGTTTYSATTGASCSTGYTPISLSGSTGSINDVEVVQGFSDILVPEDSVDAYLAGYTVFADNGSDLKLLSIKINLRFTNGDASHHLDKYANDISVLLNGRRVGSVSVSSLSENNNTYTKTIRLSDAIISADERISLYIGADTREDISFGNEDNTWSIYISEVRYTDASGASIIDSSLGDLGSDGISSFHFLPILDNND